jgi:hypothetical protein
VDFLLVSGIIFIVSAKAKKPPIDKKSVLARLEHARRISS